MMGADGTDAGDPVTWLLAADDADGLRNRLDQLEAGREPDRPGDGPARLGIVDPDERKLRLARRLVAKGEPWRGRGDTWFTPAGLAGQGGKVAFLFPGVEPTSGASDIDLPGLGRRLGLAAPSLAADTVAHQSASVYRLGIFLDLVLRRLGVEPDVVAGHSVGEWSGTVAAGMMPHEQADELIRDLGLDPFELPDVDFAALAAGADVVGAVVAGIDGIHISHDNSPSQSIICGPPAAVATALVRLREANVLGYVLPFRSGFHTPAMAPLLDRVRDLAARLPFRAGRVPMWSATLVGPYPADRAEIVDLHLRHLVEPVRFRPVIERLYHDVGARIFLQVGVGSLTQFVDDTLGGLDHAAIPLLVPKRPALAQAHRALTALWVEGLDIDPHALRCPPAPAAPDPARPVSSSAGVGGPLGAAPTPTLVAAADLLASAARSSHELMNAVLARLSVSADTMQPVPRPVPVSPARSMAAAPVQSAPTPPAQSRPTPETAWPTAKLRVTRRLSLESMPETLDHTLYLQPEGWPDVSDLFPIVAMTTQIQLLQDVVAGYAGGRDVVEVFGIRNFRWLDLSEPVDVAISLVPKGDDVLAVSLGGHCRANVRVGRFRPAPRYEGAPLARERPPKHTAQELWDQRLMFHGPRFRGIDAIGPIGDDGMLGSFTHLETPGSLLDNLGKLIAYWVIDQRGVGEGALPIGVERIELFGPPPTPGDKVRCDVRILELQRDLVRADGVIVLADGTLWCRVAGWASLVFHLDDRMEGVYHRTGTSYAVDPQPGGWAVQCERWFTGAGRELTARRFLCRAERAVYETLNVVQQRRYLLETIAVKETVRHWLGSTFGIAAYPVEVRPIADGPRRFQVDCPRLPAGHRPLVTLSTLELRPDAVAVAVAVVGDGRYRDIEARPIPAGADPDTVARETAGILAARSPDARIASVAEPEGVVPSRLVDVPDPPRFAVAWTD